MFKITLKPTFNTPQSLEKTQNQQSWMDFFCNRFPSEEYALEVSNQIKGAGIHFQCIIEEIK